MSDKNLQCVHSLLNSALCLGGIMDSAWTIILATTQQLVEILNLPDPVTGASQSHMVASKATHTRKNSSHNINISANSTSELPALGAMLSQLFEASNHLEDAALHCVIRSLCQVSEETLEQASRHGLSKSVFRNDAHLYPISKVWSEEEHAAVRLQLLSQPSSNSHPIFSLPPSSRLCRWAL